MLIQRFTAFPIFCSFIVACSTNNPRAATLCVDADQDGYDSCSDCDDGNPRVNPGAEELCDGKDNNCNGQTDEECKPDDLIDNAADSGIDVTDGGTVGPSETPPACDGGVVNDCKGCAELSSKPGSICGTCGKGKYECAGTDAVTCVGDTANSCGGCSQLPFEKGSACALEYACGVGEYICDGPDSLICVPAMSCFNFAGEAISDNRPTSVEGYACAWCKDQYNYRCPAGYSRASCADLGVDENGSRCCKGCEIVQVKCVRQ